MPQLPPPCRPCRRCQRPQRWRRQQQRRQPPQLRHVVLLPLPLRRHGLRLPRGALTLGWGWRRRLRLCGKSSPRGCRRALPVASVPDSPLDSPQGFLSASRGGSGPPPQGGSREVSWRVPSQAWQAYLAWPAAVAAAMSAAVAEVVGSAPALALARAPWQR
ncbi:hypothetical protein I4F81_007046 [Pyropia yezoensis]|uniref:Uncharacterized protein n=1 Tax=Pyropia yezoensis TaxID=2788 RepID=A0ACC3C3D8_PYRYE|nr:hypothetical protein I4F81_007046 [Neopyropia yezoensis]